MNNNLYKHSITASILLLLCAMVEIYPQSADRNYILTRTMQNESGSVYIDKIDYYDGLGRPVLTVQKTASPQKQDIVTLQEYDNIGRKSNAWLPVPTDGTGTYVPPSTITSAAASFYTDNAAYNKPIYEPSPLSRIKQQFSPGEAWHTTGKAMKTAYLSNTETGELSCELYLTDFSSMLVGLSKYPAGRLFVTQTTDGHVTYTFTDNQEQTLLVREMNGSVAHDTYYVYDDLGQLRYVLPPLCTEIDEATLNLYAYKYEYDGRGNCNQKKLPGCDPVIMKYDQADRLIFSQDGNQRAKNEWTFYLYDLFGRQTVTGTCVNPAISEFEAIVVYTDYNGGATLGGYTITPSLPSDIKLMTVNYYDDYTFTNTLTAAEQAKMPYTAVSGYDAQYTRGAKGLLTGTRAYRLDDPAKYTVSAMYYDHRGRVVQTHTSNHLGGFEDEYFAYTFTGKVKQQQHVHSASGKTTQTEIYTYTYDHAERLLSVAHKLNDAAEVTLAQYTYDEIGRLKTKKLHGSEETIHYDYNVRSWITQISGSKFNQTLAYNVAVNGISPTNALYNGNISAMKWKAGDETTERGYQFAYDRLNRMASAYYGEGSALTASSNRYNELPTYDKMGNITTLQRQGKQDSGYGLIDDLAYTYTGNQLTKVTDAVSGPLYNGAFHFMDGANVATEYVYDKNGNLTKDYNKKIVEIRYNALNLPDALQFTNGNTTNYTYDAAGTKLSVTYQTAVAGITIPMTNVMTPLASANILATTTTDYCGNVVYENGKVSRILTEEGYITLSGTPPTTPTYHYYLKDHQGNNRVVLSQNGTVEQVNHYYPFGGLFGESTGGATQPYKYNGKELDRMHGLDLFDYGARHYDATLGRWFTVDPMGEEYYNISPYVYAANNPVRLIDPNGMFLDDYQLDRLGNMHLIKRTNDDYHTIYATTTEGDIDKNNSIQVEKSFIDLKQTETLQGKYSSAADGNNATVSFSVDTYTTFDIGQATRFFEFAANNTDTEWSQTNTSTENVNGSFLKTSHSDNAEVGQSALISNIISNNQVASIVNSTQTTILEANHSHPNGSTVVSYGDHRLATKIQNRFPNAMMHIYSPHTRQYTPFSRHSIPGMLHEIIVKPKNR